MKKSIVKKESYTLDTPQKTKEMAKVLAKYITDNQLSVNIARHEYVMVEGWQFAGGLLGLYPKITEVREVAPMKWMATAHIVNRKGETVSIGYAICSKSEQKKSSFDEYAILSMAQTRAIGKAYRNYIGWIIKLAGYESTPAEEIKGKAVPVQQPLAGKSERKVDYLPQVKTMLWNMAGKPKNMSDWEACELLYSKTGIQAERLKGLDQPTLQKAMGILLSKVRSKRK